MRVTDIAFVKLIGIEQEGDKLSLDFKNDVKNHIDTIHASAQFTLAETQSGLHLQKLFPELEGRVVPILRDATVKYKKPALKKIVAFADASDEQVERFKEQFLKKGRGSIEISVEVKDIDGVLTSVAVFSWFVQKI
ncbi:YiiD C-terminal domain-containing protein [Sulfurimonas sp. CS5]|jgi:acyl-coenzyme A thioesterase PaaI-like protein|uniref:YiiD C-terminal domain-containing protein n=1 Tax=Sulfurimonas sp. CS5 TaxID=3391145 RepID=UPI0039EB4515